MRIPRVERRLLRVTDAIIELEHDHERLVAEVEEHRMLHEDLRIAAIDGSAEDRAAYREIQGDLARFERSLERLRLQIEHLLARRVKLLARLDD